MNRLQLQLLVGGHLHRRLQLRSGVVRLHFAGRTHVYRKSQTKKTKPTTPSVRPAPQHSATPSPEKRQVRLSLWRRKWEEWGQDTSPAPHNTPYIMQNNHTTHTTSAQHTKKQHKTTARIVDVICEAAIAFIDISTSARVIVSFRP